MRIKGENWAMVVIGVVMLMAGLIFFWSLPEWKEPLEIPRVPMAAYDAPHPIPQEPARIIHIVEPGETLYDIAKEYGEDWKDLVELNRLEVEWKDGIPYVWLRIGQEVTIKGGWTQAEIDSYREQTTKMVTSAMLEMAHKGLTKYVERSMIDPFGVLAEPEKHSVAEIEKEIRQVRERIRFMERARRIKLAREIVDVVNLWSFRNPFAKNNKPWVAHRKLSMLITATAWVESNGFNVYGHHGEVNFLQIKPATACRVWGWKPTKTNIAKAQAILYTNPFRNILTTMDILNNSGSTNVRTMARYYNKGSSKYAYARKIARKYARLMR